MSRRDSGSSFSSSSDVNFDDLDDQQVFGFLEDDDDARGSGSRSRRCLCPHAALPMRSSIALTCAVPFQSKRRLPPGLLVEAQRFVCPAPSHARRRAEQTCSWSWAIAKVLLPLNRVHLPSRQSAS